MERFGRALSEQPAVVMVDPFMGCGGVALAANKLGCPFVGMDRDGACVHAAEQLFDRLSVTPVQ
jgi:tRNA G10  N-methylase Trm11